MTFAELGLSPEIQRAIDELGYTEPTPIQAKAIPLVMSGCDLMAAAQTGTGKTAAFVLPLLERLKKFASSSASPAMHPVRALILTPTRELADQVGENARLYTKYLPLRTTTVYGGINMDPQVAELRRGVEILIATPGRLLDHVGQKTVMLNRVDVLVLDEADRMLDMGFIQDIRKILALLPKERQTMLFSATFSPEIKRLAADFMKSPQTIEVARQNSTNEDVEQLVYQVDSYRKRHLLSYLIRERQMGQAIVFCRTKISADQLARDLKRDGHAAEAIHGDKAQSARQETLNQFKAGEVKVLVATDVAARGLDINELPYVVNYEMPNAPEDYVHRIGRTGRAGASGVAITFMAQGEERQLEGIEKLTRQKFTPKTVEGFQPSWLQAQTLAKPAAHHTDAPRAPERRPLERKPQESRPAEARAGQRPERKEVVRRSERHERADRNDRSSDRTEFTARKLVRLVHPPRQEVFDEADYAGQPDSPRIAGRNDRKPHAKREVPALLLPPRYK
ncbi:DEAD/DEAH box helicase [Craterilacuibacter sp. RT1T]|uniref:DEAD/DEAH box helicase n=1 Tax=Craterilacuibacter sp. RT1T TaxID=2942211 RepID=UPI0020BEAFE5|nr:DEAD/DEAH box helicase [Craterilacuibacter sp. RT1T]MCL6263710.1 DEAD/DEAH box helicase [Craterilacuibacter sp. RT1T]